MTGHDNPFLYPEAIDRGREAEDLRRIYEQNKTDGIVSESASSVGIEALKDIVHAETEKAQTTARLDQINNPEFRKAFSEAMNETEHLFERINMTVPTPDNFSETGVDFNDLAAVYENMYHKNLQPEIVISPSLVGINEWSEIYESIQDDDTIQNNPLFLRAGPDGEMEDPLQVLPEAKANWDDFNSPTLADVPIFDGWTIRIVPGLVTSEDYHIPDDAGESMTLPEYLTLQARFCQREERLMDSELFDNEAMISTVFGSTSFPLNPGTMYGSYIGGRSGCVYIGYSSRAFNSETSRNRKPEW